jgi:hypothetical protein
MVEFLAAAERAAALAISVGRGVPPRVSNAPTS